MEGFLIMNLKTSSLSMKDIISCFKTPEKKPITDLNLKNQPSKFFIDSGQVKEVKGTVNKIVHKIKKFFGLIESDWGESRQTEMRAILKSIRIELGKMVDDCELNNKSLPQETIVLYTNPKKNYAINLASNSIYITQLSSNKHASLEHIELINLPDIESCSVFIGELLKHHHSNIKETDTTFTKSFDANPELCKIYDKKSGKPLRYELQPEDDSLQVKISLNTNYDITDDKLEFISGRKTDVKLKPNGMVQKRRSGFSKDDILRLNSFARFIQKRTQNPDTKNSSQIIVPIMGKKSTLYMPRITKNPDLQLEKLYKYPDEEIKLKVKDLYKTLLDEIQKIMSDNTYYTNSQFEGAEAYNYQFSDFKLAQLVYGKKRGDTEDDLYLVDTESGVLNPSTLNNRPTTHLYSSGVFIDHRVKNSDGEYEYKFSANTEQFLAILISTVELYTGFRFTVLKNKDEHDIFWGKLEETINPNKLAEVRELFKGLMDYYNDNNSNIEVMLLSESEFQQLEDKKDGDISFDESTKRIYKYINGNIESYYSLHNNLSEFAEKLQKKQPIQYVELCKLFIGCSHKKKAHTVIERMLGKYFKTSDSEPTEKLSDLFI